MVRRFANRRAILGAREVGALRTMQTTPDYLLSYPLQETSGAVSEADNIAVALGREQAANSDFAAGDDGSWTKGVGWSIVAGTASVDGSQVAISDLEQNAAAAIGKTFEVIFILSNYSAGTFVPIFGGDVGTVRNANGTYTETLTPINTSNLRLRASITGVGDLTLMSVKQTNILASSAFPGAEELSQAGDGVMDKDNWDVVNNATLTNPQSDILRIARNGTNNPAGQQTTIFTVGERSVITGEIRSDGNAIPRFADGVTVWWDGFTSTEWQGLNIEIAPTAGTLARFVAVTSTGTEYIECRNLSITEANPLNSDDTGTTPGVAGNGRVQYVKSADAATTFIDFYSAELNSMISWDKGSMIIVASSDTWAVGIDYLVNMAVDANNGVKIRRNATNLIVAYEAGGVEESITIPSGSPTGLFGVGLTWNTNGAGAVKGLYQGAQSGATQTIANTLIGNVASTLCTIFSLNDTPSSVWAGDGAYLGIFTRDISVAEFARICRSWGVS